MMIRGILSAFCALAVCLGLLAIVAAPMPAAAQGADALWFVVNMGQREAGVEFHVVGATYNIDLNGDGATLATIGEGGSTTLDLSYDGASASPMVEGTDRLRDASFRFADDPDKPLEKVGVFGTVVYHDQYPGIDLSYSGSIGSLERSFDVGAGADPGAIRMRYGGLTPEVAPDGSLRLKDGAVVVLTESAPSAHQTVGGNPVPVGAAYDPQPDGSIGFTLDAYDSSRALYIGAALDFSALVDSATEEAVRDANTDPQTGEMVITQVSDVLPLAAILETLAENGADAPLAGDDPEAPAALIPDGDYGGGDLVPANGDTLGGTYTNVGLFHIGAGITVDVAPGNDLAVLAEEILIEGTLNGAGGGYIGGPNPQPNQAGVAGQGPGGGGAGLIGSSIHGPGGGAGGYGGVGGGGGRTLSSPAEAPGGGTYGAPNPPGIQMGSGGGSAASHTQGAPPALGGFGGNGGAGITLDAPVVSVSGSVIADGADGGPGIDGQFGLLVSGGGGGSGGGIWLNGCLELTDATLSALGGTGGSSTGSGGFGVGGGGGGGGRIKLSGEFDQASTYIAGAAGGAAGFTGYAGANKFPDPGQIGSVVDVAVSADTCRQAASVGGFGIGEVQVGATPALAVSPIGNGKFAVAALFAALVALGTVGAWRRRR